MDLSQDKQEANVSSHSCQQATTTITSLSQSEQFDTAKQAKRKYIKKATTKFRAYIEIDKVLMNRQRSYQLNVSPLYQEIPYRLEFVLIGGDVLMHAVPENNKRSNRIDTFNEYKEIVCISTNEQFISVQMINKLNGISDIRFLIQSLQKFIDETLGESSLEALLGFQQILIQNELMINSIMVRFPNKDDLQKLQSRRKHFLIAEGEKYIRNNFREDDFLIYGLSMIDFNKKQPTIQNFSFNQSLVSLIGSNFDQLQRYFLRKGVYSFFDFKTRLIIQQKHIYGVQQKFNEKFELPYTLVTFDDLSVDCKVEVQTLFCELPEEYRYNSEGDNPFELQEGLLILRIILTQDQIDHVQKARELKQKDKDENLIFLKEQDISYEIQAQHLIDKFYDKTFDATVFEKQKESILQQQRLEELNKNAEIKRCDFVLLEK